MWRHRRRHRHTVIAQRAAITGVAGQASFTQTAREKGIDRHTAADVDAPALRRLFADLLDHPADLVARNQWQSQLAGVLAVVDLEIRTADAGKLNAQ